MAADFEKIEELIHEIVANRELSLDSTKASVEKLRAAITSSGDQVPAMLVLQLVGFIENQAEGFAELTSDYVKIAAEIVETHKEFDKLSRAIDELLGDRGDAASDESV